ncbi:TPA: hypothetical protein ACGTRQ_003766 [Vibrio parahaemolyticus]
MISDHHAEDSRDFGPVPEHNIIATVVPVLILWGNRQPHEEVAEDESKKLLNSEQGLTFYEHRKTYIPSSSQGEPKAVRCGNLVWSARS